MAVSIDVARSTARKRALVALIVVAGYALLIGVCNWLASMAGDQDDSPWMIASGLLMSVVAIPVFSIAIPLLLARRWNLAYRWWPEKGRWASALALVFAYTLLANFQVIRSLVETGVDPARFALHAISAMLFHVTYYPLFAILLLRAFERWLGLPWGIAAAATAFSLYHLFQWHFFPDGTEPLWLLLLFVAFAADLVVYLLSRSLMLVALAHSLSGAAGMASAGTYFDEVDFVFFATIIIVGGLLIWSLFDRRGARPASEGSDAWLTLKPETG